MKGAIILTLALAFLALASGLQIVQKSQSSVVSEEDSTVMWCLADEP